MPISTTLSVAASLLATVAVIVLTGRLLKLTKFGRPRNAQQGRLGLLDSLALDPRRRLVLVRCDDRCALMLLGQHDQVIGWLPDATP